LCSSRRNAAEALAPKSMLLPLTGRSKVFSSGAQS
jgi:hypothetical protein